MEAPLRLIARVRAVFSRIPPRRAGIALLCCAALCTAWALLPRTEATPVLVAARDLAPGTVLTGDDLRIAEYPRALVPAGALASASEATGAALSGGLTSGAPLTDASVLAPDTATREAGSLLVPTVFGDAQTAATLRPGHRLRVYAAMDPLLEGASADVPGEAADGLTGGSPDGEEDAALSGGMPDESGTGDGASVPAATGALVDEATVTSVQAQGTGLGPGTTVVTLAVAEVDAGRLARAAGAHLSFALLN